MKLSVAKLWDTVSSYVAKLIATYGGLMYIDIYIVYMKRIAKDDRFSKKVLISGDGGKRDEEQEREGPRG